MFTSVAQANDAVIERIRNARPHWLDVQPAGSLIGALNQNKTLLHAGPPMRWQEMTGPMKGACIGACLFEGWAQDEKTAHAMLEGGEITFIPCHHVNAVGPMGGITSPNMPMLVVENIAEGNRAYCNLNEGIGKVMRFGAYGEDVQQRLRWMRDVLMPVLSAALKQMERGIDLTAMMAQGITMGDEFHQRNIATSALLMRTLAPYLARLNHDKQQIAEVMDFLAITDQFFLNLAMAYCKAAMDSGAQIRAGSLVTAMTRNGNMFGIRVSGRQRHYRNLRHRRRSDDRRSRRHALCRRGRDGGGEIRFRGDGGNLPGTQYAAANSGLGFPGRLSGAGYSPGGGNRDYAADQHRHRSQRGGDRPDWRRDRQSAAGLL